MQTQNIVSRVQQTIVCAHNVANGIVSLFLLISGIILSALLAAFISKTVDIVDDVISRSADQSLQSLFDLKNLTDYVNGYIGNSGDTIDHVSLQQTSEIIQNIPLWLIGFAYIVPGFIGLCATLCHNKAVYVAQMVMSIITLLVMGILFLISVFALAVFAPLDPHQCTSMGQVNGFCRCPSIDYVSCDDINSLFSVSVAFMIFIVLGWILTLTGTIVAGILACRNEVSQYGMMLHPPSHLTTPLSFERAAELPSCAYSPGHDHAELLKGLEPRDFSI